MRKRKTVFIHEFELATTPQQARLLGIRLKLGRQMYNAMLGKARARFNRVKRLQPWKDGMALLRQARAYERRQDALGAKALRLEARQRQAVAIHQVMQEERDRYAPTSTAKADRLKDPAPAIMTRLRQAHFEAHLDFKSVQGLATRAYQAVDQLRYKRPTRHKDGSLKFPKVHFLPKGEVRAIDSTGIHWRGDSLEWNSKLHKLRIPVRFDPADTKGIQAHALAQMQDPANICESKRVLTRTVREEVRWYVQLTIKGHPAWKEAQYPPGHGKTVGIDFGPSKIGLCWKGPDGTLCGAKLELAEGLRHDYARIRRLERYRARSRRATNPDNYEANGVPKKGLREEDWHKSERYKQATGQLADLWRTYAAHRKNLLGQLANQIIAHGTTISIEKLSYKAWQKTWGKSIGRGAPGMLVAMLRRKAEQCGGTVVEFGTRQTKFSQLCHRCGTYTKKTLKQRIHRCECGVGPIDRDVYSAFLAYHYTELARSTPDREALDASFTSLKTGRALQCAAVAIRDLHPAASIPAPRAGTTSQTREAQSCSTAPRALCSAKARADVDARKRQDHTPTFQDPVLSADGASIAADIPSGTDARTLQSQENGDSNDKKERPQRRKHPPPQGRSQETAQLRLFPGLGGPGG